MPTYHQGYRYQGQITDAMFTRDGAPFSEEEQASHIADLAAAIGCRPDELVAVEQVDAPFVPEYVIPPAAPAPAPEPSPPSRIEQLEAQVAALSAQLAEVQIATGVAQPQPGP